MAFSQSFNFGDSTFMELEKGMQAAAEKAGNSNARRSAATKSKVSSIIVNEIYSDFFRDEFSYEVEQDRPASEPSMVNVSEIEDAFEAKVCSEDVFGDEDKAEEDDRNLANLDESSFLCPARDELASQQLKLELLRSRVLSKQRDHQEISRITQNLSSMSPNQLQVSPNSSSIREEQPKVRNPPIDLQSLKSIAAWNLPHSIQSEYKKKGVLQMFDWQVECLSKPRVLFEHCNLVYSAPTSAGKTLVSEILILKTVLERGKKVLLILPFISVVREKMFYLQDLLTTAGYRVEGFFGGYTPPGGFENINVAICTIEKANSIINKLLEQGTLDTIGTVVVDEVHLISDKGRGYILELLLAKILYMSRRNALQIQVITMSATLANVELLQRWLDAEMYITDYRPVALQEMVKVGTKIFDHQLKFLRDVSQQSEVKQALSNDSDHVAQLCIETLLEGCSVIVFCPSKDWCENLAVQLATAMHGLIKSGSDLGQRLRDNLNPEAIEEVKKQLRDIPTGIDAVMSKAVTYACAFHHAGLTTEERDIVEASFKAGSLKVLVATSTLSSGVNLPARRVLIRSPLFGGKQMNSLTYRQMIGRAGRTGKDTLGESILICTESNARIGRELLTAQMQPITSCLELDGSTHLKRALLEVISSGVASTREDIDLFVNCTLLSAQKQLEAASSDGERSAEEDANYISDALDFLVEYEFIRLQTNEETNISTYVATRLGAACLASSMPPTDGLILFAELQKSHRCFVLESELHAVYLVTPYSVCYQLPDLDWLIYLNMWEHLTPAMKKVGELVGVKEAFLIKAMRGQTKLDYKQMQVHKRFYTALALQELVNETPINVVVHKFKCHRGMLQSLQQMASTFAGIVTAFCNSLQWSTLALIVSQFKDRLFFGIHRDLIDLMRLPDLSQKRARALFDAGFTSLVELAGADALKLEKVLFNSLSFDSAKQHDQENAQEAAQRNKLRNFFITGKAGMTVAEAARLLITEARQFVQYEVGVGKIKWKEMQVEDSELHMSVEEEQVQSEMPFSKRGLPSEERNSNAKENTSQAKISRLDPQVSKGPRSSNERKESRSENVKQSPHKNKHGNSSNNRSPFIDKNGNLANNQSPLKDKPQNSAENRCLDKDIHRKSAEKAREVLPSTSNVQQSIGTPKTLLGNQYQNLPKKEKTAPQTPSDKTNKNAGNSAGNSVPSRKDTPKKTQSTEFHKVKVSAATVSNSLTPCEEVPSTSAQAQKELLAIQIAERRRIALMKIKYKQAEQAAQPPMKRSSSTVSVTTNSPRPCQVQPEKEVSSDNKENLAVKENLVSLPLQKRVPSGTPISPSKRSRAPSREISTLADNIFLSDLENPSSGKKSSHRSPQNHTPTQSRPPSRKISSVKSPRVSLPRRSPRNHTPTQSKASRLEENPMLSDDSFIMSFGVTAALKAAESKMPSAVEDEIPSSQPKEADIVVTALTPHASRMMRSYQLRSQRLQTPRTPSSSSSSKTTSREPETVRTEPTGSSMELSDLSMGNSLIKLPHQLNASHILSCSKEVDGNASSFGSISIIDVCGDQQLFQMALKELLAATRCGFSVALQAQAGRQKPLIGANLLMNQVAAAEQRKAAAGEQVLFQVDDTCFVAGLSFCLADNVVYYLNMQEEGRVPTSLKEQELCKLLARPELTLIMHDSKEQLKKLLQAMPTLGKISCKLADAKVANWVLQPDNATSLQNMCQQFAPECTAVADLCGSGRGYNSHGLDISSAILPNIRASVEACVAVHILQGQLENLERIGKGSLLKFYLDIEMPIQLSLCHMETVGFPVKEQHLQRLYKQMMAVMNLVEKKIYELHGSRFNLASTQAVGKVLGLHRKPSGRVSTSRQVLEKMDSPISQLILAHRKLSMLTAKSLQPLLKCCESNRIHGQSITYTATGRISMADPNLQNVAKDFVIKLGADSINLSCRSAFGPVDEQMCLLSADYCQVEMRILAHLSEDKTLLEVMNSPQDLFTAIAAHWNSIEESEVSENMRNGTKQICYGIVYGMGMRSLAEALKCTEQEAQMVSEQFHQAYPGIRTYTQKVVNFARNKGYVETIMGRRRYLENINSGEAQLRGQAERQAVNSCIQGSAADIAKRAIVKMETYIARYRQKLGLTENSVRLVLHLHDEMIFELPRHRAKQIAKMLSLTMAGCAKLKVPLKVRIKVGRSWGELKEIEL